VEHNEIPHFALRAPFGMTMKQQCNATRFLISRCALIRNDNEKQRKALSSRTNVRDLNVQFSGTQRDSSLRAAHSVQNDNETTMQRNEIPHFVLRAHLE